MTARGRSPGRRRFLAGCLAMAMLASAIGCQRSDPSVASESEGKNRIGKLFKLYKAYVERNKKGPPDEQSLRDFGNKLTAEERASYLIGDEIDSLFESPRDKQKYVIRYNVKLEPTAPKGVIWEVAGERRVSVRRVIEWICRRIQRTDV
jgi:hypothetical protein